MVDECERPVRYPCPCCGYPTLDESASHEICRVCDWQDDGQGDDDADDVGGPNSGQSLTYARDQFKRGMLSPSKGEPVLQRNLFECYERWKTAPDCERDDLLSEVLRLEAEVLEDMALNTSKYFLTTVDMAELVQVGGIYSAKSADEFVIVKILAYQPEKDCVYARLFAQRTAERPNGEWLASRQLDSLDSELGLGIGALPITTNVFRYWQPELILVQEVKAEEKEDLDLCFDLAIPYGDLAYP